jgi:hypothetical protein
MAHTDKVTDLTTDETDNADNVSAKRQKMTATPIAVIVMNDSTEGSGGTTIYLNRTGVLNPEMEWFLMHMRMNVDPFPRQVLTAFYEIVTHNEPTKQELEEAARPLAKKYIGIDEDFLRRAWKNNQAWKGITEKEFNMETGALSTSMRVILADGRDY